jgi:thymidylate kinase
MFSPTPFTKGISPVGGGQFDLPAFLRVLKTVYRLLAYPLPDVTFVLHAPIDVVRERVEKRDGRKISASELETLDKFGELYRTLAHAEDSHFYLSSDGDFQQLVDTALAHILTAMQQERRV